MAHGDLDPLVPVADARHFADSLRRTSASPVVYAELRDGNHAFDLCHPVRFQAVEGCTAWVRSRERASGLNRESGRAAPGPAGGRRRAAPAATGS